MKASEAQLHVVKSTNATKKIQSPLPVITTQGKRDGKRYGSQALLLFSSFLSGIIAANHF